LSVEQLTGDRTDADTMADVARRVEPDVIDCAGYYPADIRTVTELFADVDASVYVSSGGVYAEQEIPKREEVTPLYE
jgi:hypothetical protein